MFTPLQATVATETLLQYFPIINDLCNQCLILGKLSQQAWSQSENKLIEDLLHTMQFNFQTVHTLSINAILYGNHTNLLTKTLTNIEDIYKSITKNHTEIWNLLKIPGSSKFRTSVVYTLIHFENLIRTLFSTLVSTTNNEHKFKKIKTYRQTILYITNCIPI